MGRIKVIHLIWNLIYGNLRNYVVSSSFVSWFQTKNLHKDCLCYSFLRYYDIHVVICNTGRRHTRALYLSVVREGGSGWFISVPTEEVAIYIWYEVKTEQVGEGQIID